MAPSSDSLNWPGIVIFLATYALICARRASVLRVDRPAIALMGAVACVDLGILGSEEALRAVNAPTILLLFSVMGMGAFLAVDGFFDDLEPVLARLARTPERLLGLIVWGAGVFSALITNDAVCVLGTPLVVRMIEQYRLPPLPFLVALATAANTGSAATLVGNPQNMLCGILGGLSYREYLLRAGPVTAICLGINHLFLRYAFRNELKQCRLDVSPSELRSPFRRRTVTTLAVILGTAVAYTAGADLAWAAATGLALLILIHRRGMERVWANIDWSLLLFFAGLFIVVEGFTRSGAPAWFFARYSLAGIAEAGLAGWLGMALVFLLGSNLVSNVPFILLIAGQLHALPHAKAAWELLALASTFAGNLTLLGSAANVIVAERARRLGGMGFFEHVKVGFPLAVVTTLVAALWMYVWR